MPDQTINSALARKRIAVLNSRLERYPEHPQKAVMLSELNRYKALLVVVDNVPTPNRLLNRVDTLVGAIRKIDMLLDAVEKHPMQDRMLQRRVEYQTSLKNIQEFGRERVAVTPEGVKIEVPADVLEARSE